MIKAFFIDFEYNHAPHQARCELFKTSDNLLRVHCGIKGDKPGQAYNYKVEDGALTGFGFGSHEENTDRNKLENVIGQQIIDSGNILEETGCTQYVRSVYNYETPVIIMEQIQVTINGTVYTNQEESFIEKIELQSVSQSIHITPLSLNGKVEWFQIIFETGDKRYIEQGLSGWKFLDQVPEEEDVENPEADDDLELSTKVGEAIEGYYNVQ